MPPHISRFTFHVALTAILVGYLSTWLVGPAAGLSFLGLEMGEWVKFFGVGWQRDYFYLPPITLGLMLALMTVNWENGRFQTWVMRGTAVLVSLLAFPAIEDLTSTSRNQYIFRVVLIGIVTVTAVLSGVAAQKRPIRWHWLLLLGIGVIGLVVPTWMIMEEIRPFVNQVLGVSVGIGVGVWLNAIGHLFVIVVSFLEIRDWRLQIINNP